jgi:hypothetical protein
MPASVVNIGGPTSGNTWAAVRCPLYKGTGFRDETLPANKNWSRAYQPYATQTPFSSGYPEPVTPILRAFPFMKGFSNSFQGRSTSMGLGVRYFYIQIGTETTPYIVEFFLCVGEGFVTKYFPEPTKIDEGVYMGYGDFGPDPDSGLVGYDINSTRGIMKDATIAINLKPGPTLGTVSVSKTLNTINLEKLFPDDVSGEKYDATSGISLGQFTWPVNPTEDWVPPHWTITSVALA